ncbi:MAG: hypothetical protein GXO74_08755 [Calditrichaeota bacterium]|nr:hypothetical protein [Calditrichota bacterium]
MSECKKIRQKMPEAVYSELTEDEKKDFFRHLDSCPACRTEFAKMKNSLNAMSQWQRHEPGNEFWENYWANLAPRLSEKAASVGFVQKLKNRILPEKISFARFIPQFAAAVVILIFGIFIGKFLFNGKTDTNLAESNFQLSGQQNQPELISAERYLEKSKIILLGLVNFDPKKDDPYVLNLPYQKKLSQNLAFQANYLKTELTDSGYAALADLIGQLEIIMLQIANLEKSNNLPGIALIKAGVKRNGILLQISLEEMGMTGKKETNLNPGKTSAKI